MSELSYEDVVGAFQSEGFAPKDRLVKWTQISESPPIFFHKGQGTRGKAEQRHRRYHTAHVICDPRWEGVRHLEKTFGEPIERLSHNLTVFPRKKNAQGQEKPYGLEFKLNVARLGDFAREARRLISAGRNAERAASNDPGGVPAAPTSAADVSSTTETSAAGQGYEQDPEVRRVLEQHAMKLAIEYYGQQGEVVVVGKPYDLDCRAPGEHFRVEVKGTKGLGEVVRVTKNEVKQARDPSQRVELFIVSKIAVVGAPGSYEAVGGQIRTIREWRPAEEDLEAVEYNYWVPA